MLHSPHSRAFSFKYNTRVFLNPKKLLDKMRVPFGAKAADFGAGAGHYALALLERMENGGSVYAIDAHAPSLDSLRREARARNASLYTLHSDLNKHIPLKDSLLKIGIAANVLHHIEDRPRFASEVARVVESGGEVLVVDWVSSFRNMGPAPEKAVAPAEAARLFESAGFTIGDMMPAGTHHFAFIATRA